MLSNADDAALPVTVLTGFLGAGKTTILNRLVRRPEFARTLVIINEFGSIGIDHHLVAPSREETVVEMASGCLCCTIRGDLVRLLRDAPWRFARDGVCWFDRVLIETTGLADPAPVLHSFMADPVLNRLYRIDAVVTVVDGVHGWETLDRQPEAAKQAAVADHILLSKTDLVTTDEIDRLCERLSRLNPGARPVRIAHGELDPAGLFEGGLFDPSTKTEDVRRWLNAEAYGGKDHGHGDGHHHHHHDVNRHGDDIRAISLTLDEPVSDLALERWLDVLMMVKGAEMLRMKGLVNVIGHDAPIVLHGVQHMLHEPIRLERWPDDDRRSRLIFIARGVKESELRNTLNMIVDGMKRFELTGADDLGLFAYRGPGGSGMSFGPVLA